MTANRQAFAPERLLPLDGLRGCAALAVMVSHSANRGYLPNVLGNGFGAMGVSLFYVLSGFLMAYLYLQRPLTAGNLREFALRRAARIVPLYYLCVFGAMIVAAAFGWVVYISAAPEDFALSLLFLRGRGVLWSIPVEVQFYAIFCVLWWCRGKGRFWQAMAALLTLELAFHLLVDRGYNTIFKWFHIFAIGVMIGVAFSRYAKVFAEVEAWRSARWAGWLLVLFLPVVLPEARARLGVAPLPANIDPVSVGYPVLLLVFALIGTGVFRYLAQPALRWMGRISFGVYLLHIPALHVADYLAKAALLPVWLGFGFVVLLTCGAATALNRLVEQPARSVGKKFAASSA